MRVLLLSLSLAALPALPAAAGNVYKWKDASGQVHYTQTPPPAGATEIAAPRLASAAANPPAAAPAAAAPATTPAPKPAEAKLTAKLAAPVETKEAKLKRCTESRERLAFLEERTARRLMIAQPDGSTSRMTEEEFAESVAKATEAGKGC